MANPSRDKGNAFEWDLIRLANDPDGRLIEAGLTVERTRAGYERDEGDLHVLTPDRQRLVAIQAKNRRERKWSEWLAATERQGVAARARFAALIVKRNGIGGVGRSYVISTVTAYFDLLAALRTAERRAQVAEHLLAEQARAIEHLNARVQDGDRWPVLTSDGLTGPDPDAVADPPGYDPAHRADRHSHDPVR